MRSLSTLSLFASMVGTGAEPVKLIVDTDIGGGGCEDVDDVAAVVIANALMDNGEADLIAVVVNTSPLKCPGVISVLNHYYGRDELPIGSYKGTDLEVSDPHFYVDDLVDNWDSSIKTASQVPSSVDVYRAALAAAPDHSVAISSIGLMTNLRALLQSAADEHSPLSGPDLVAQKVKLLAAMAGTYPSGNECNMCGGGGQDHATGAAASAYVYANWPPSVQIIFSGGELGGRVQTGATLYDCVDASNPARQAFIDYVGYGNTRPSWDPLTTVVAVRGPASMGCSLCSDCDGIVSVDPISGHSDWISGPPSNQTYMVLNDAQMAADAMNVLMCQAPANPQPAPPPPPPPPAPPAPEGVCALAATAMAGAEPGQTAYGGGDYTTAWDGDIKTFYDYTQADGGYTQAALAAPSQIALIAYYPRISFLERHLGGRFVGVTSAGDEVPLVTVTEKPKRDWNEFSVNSTSVVHSVKYYSPDGGFGNIAEIVPYTACAMII